MSWDNASHVLGSKLSRKILECLESSEKPLTPVEISKLTDIARSNISTKLGKLRERNLVKCVNPNARKWRFYTITGKGKEVLRKINEVKK